MTCRFLDFGPVLDHLHRLKRLDLDSVYANSDLMDILTIDSKEEKIVTPQLQFLGLRHPDGVKSSAIIKSDEIVSMCRSRCGQHSSAVPLQRLHVGFPEALGEHPLRELRALALADLVVSVAGPKVGRCISVNISGPVELTLHAFRTRHSRSVFLNIWICQSRQSCNISILIRQDTPIR